ncbi:hypothetical protein BD626DRAFT_579563 [Schizophyllum amplum]|uniref:2OGFeDO JBP1/TET oxygenase domain-containing protein n=1 Tax=Schizophyllum amplum TaxID=97359 RepID=A0A550BRC0_9AGAR|nr:hypothetical protein BD626DRAFT_579563 [Auriculariopsis ampla]
MHSRDQRRKRRKTAAQEQPERKRRHHQHVARSSPKHVDFDLRKARVASTGFRGLYEDEVHRTFTRQQLEAQGFVYFPWNGVDTIPLVAPLAADKSPGNAPPPEPDDVNSGREHQESWDDAHKALADAIDVQRTRATFGKCATEHRRGRFGAQAEGISHGGGQLRPARLVHNKAMTLVLTYLINLPAMIRVAHFASCVFATWAPQIHCYYADVLAALLLHDPDLFANFTQSVWCCITINFGPRTVTFPHRDYGNLPFGWCAITALGRFDPDAGGELILWDCKMIIRFPPGSTIIVPSAILQHSNTRIAKHERRFSVTQYTAGAIFRWAEHGFQLDEDYYADLTQEELAKDKETTEARWRRGRRMFSKFSDLVAAAEKALAK